MASAGIGNIISSANTAICAATQTLTQTQINLMLMIPQALMHGIAQGIIQGVSGGNAGQSFVTAALSSIATGGFGMTTGSFGQRIVGKALFGAVAGGLTSRLQGGNFWEGAAIGLTVSALNHAMHPMEEPEDIIRINTKDKTATVERTGDNYDRIFVNGEEIMATPRGALGPELRGAGYDISMKGPQGVGMGLTDLALETFGGMKVLGGLRTGVSKFFGAKLFESKTVGYASRLFGRYHPKFLPAGTKGTLNSGFIRTGWGNNAGVNTFRTSVGHTPNQLGHLDWFWKP